MIMSKKCGFYLVALLALLPNFSASARTTPTLVPGQAGPAAHGLAADGPSATDRAGEVPAGTTAQTAASELLSSRLAAGQDPDTVKGFLDVLAPHGRPMAMVLRSFNGTPYPLVYNETLYHYHGKILSLRLSPSSSGAPGSAPSNPLFQNSTPFNFDIEDVDVPVEQKGWEEPVFPSRIRSVVFLLSFCGFGPSVSKPAFETIWLNNGNSDSGASSDSSPRTMQDYVFKCSHGHARLDASLQTVVEVPLPCSGQALGRTFNFRNKCSVNELYSMMALAEDYVTWNLDLDISYKRQRIAVLPRELETACGWSGLATVGCKGGPCYSWISGRQPTSLLPHFRNLGHNLGLMPSRRTDAADDSGDSTCAMGSGNGCFNAANQWRLLWGDAVPNGNIDGCNLRVGTPRSYTLPPYDSRTTDQSYVLVQPTWAVLSQELEIQRCRGNGALNPAAVLVPRYFISLWVSEGDILNPETRRVVVHASNDTYATISWAFPLNTGATGESPRLEAQLTTGERYSSPHGFMVTVESIDPAAGARIRIFRTQPAAGAGFGACADGVDNDYDGDVDEQDECEPATSSAASPPSPPPPSPSPPPPSPPPPSVRRPERRRKPPQHKSSRPPRSNPPPKRNRGAAKPTPSAR